MKTSKLLFLLLPVIYFSCSSEIEPINPYDPESPKTIQARGELNGVVSPEDYSDIKKVNFTVSIKDTSYTALAERDGRFTIRDIEKGTYFLRIVASDPTYYDAEVGPVTIIPGQKTSVGVINLNYKKGIVRGYIKKKDEKNNSETGVGNARVSLISGYKSSGFMMRPAPNNCDNFNMGKVYTSTSDADGSFIFDEVKVGTYSLSSFDENNGLGFLGNSVVVEENKSVDIGVVNLVPPSALIQAEEENSSGRPISVTKSDKIKIVFFYGDFLKEFRLSVNSASDDTGWKELTQNRYEIVEFNKGEGEYNIYVKFRDILCRETPLYSVKVFLDKTPPVAENIYFPDAVSDYINSDNIRIALTAGDNYSGFKNLSLRKIIVDEDELPGSTPDGSFFEERQIAFGTFSGEFSEPITGKTGKKILLLQLRDEAGNESEVYKKEFFFDNIMPEIDIEADGAKSINGTETVNSAFVNLRIKSTAPNKVADIDRIKVFFGSESEPQNWDVYRDMYPVVLPVRNGVLDIKVRVADRAGNVSNVFTKRIAVDTLPPQISSIRVNNEKKYTNSNLVNIEISGQDISEMIISNNYDFSGSGWVQYANSLSNYDIGSSEGLHNIFFRFRDASGNETDAFVKELILDTTPPCSPENISVSNSRFSAQKNKYFTNVSTPLFSWQYLCPDSGEIEKYRIEIYKDYEIYFTGESYTSNTIIPYIQDGEYLVKISATDWAGNRSLSPVEIPLVIDTIPPTSPRLKKVEYTKTNLPAHPDCQFLGYIDVDISVLPDDENITDYKFQISGGYDENCFYINWFMDIKDLPNQLIDEDTVRFYVAQNDTTTLMIRGVDEAGNYSDIDFVTITEDSLPPNNIRNLKAENNDSKVLISWEPPDYESDISGYLIYYGYSNYSLNGSFADNGSSPINVGKPCKIDNNGKEVCEFWLTGVPNGMPFYIDVAAYDDTKPNPNIGSISFKPAMAIAGEISPDLIRDISLNEVGAETDSSFEAVEERDGLLYVTTGNKNGNGGLHIIDVSSPRTPVLLGHIKRPEFKTMHQLELYGRYAFVADGENGVVIFDVSEPSNIKVVKNITLPVDNFASSLAFNNNYLFVGVNGPNPNPSNSSIWIYDISDISNPQLKKTQNLTIKYISSMVIQGIYLYVGAFYDNMFIFNISDIENITLKQELSQSTIGMEVFQDKLYILDSTEMSIFRYNSPLSPGNFSKENEISTNDIGLNIISEGIYYYISTNGGIRIFRNYGQNEFLYEIENDNYGHLRNNISTDKYYYVTQKDIDVSKTLLFVSNFNSYANSSSIKIFSLANPRSPKKVGEYYYTDMNNLDITIYKELIGIIDTSFIEFGKHINDLSLNKTYQDDLGPSHGKYINFYDSGVYAVTDDRVILYHFNLNQVLQESYNISNSSNREIISAIPVDGYLFVGVDNNKEDYNNCIEEIEIVSLKDFTLRNTLTIGNCGQETHYVEQNYAFALFSRYLYVAVPGRGILIYDISEVESPVLKNIYINNHGHMAGELSISGRYLYYSSYSALGVIRAFLGDPVNPELRNLKTSDSYVNKIVISGEFAYTGLQTSLTSYDFSNDGDNVYSKYFFNVYEAMPSITGNIAYVSNLNRGIIILKLE